MQILNNFDTEANFWKINPQLVFPKEFSNLRGKDKSRDKKISSKIMWGITLLLDPDSKFSNIPFNDRKKMIARDYLQEKNFKWEGYKEAIGLYEKLILSPAKRQVNIWNKKMDEKTEYLESLTYEEDSETIEKLLTTNAKLYAELDRITKQLEKEESEGITKGGVEESAVEKGVL